MKGKKVLLTGGTGGLGLGVTPLIATQDVEITIPYTNPKNVERLKGLLPPAQFARIRFVSVNLTDEKAVENLINDMGKVDVLIHLVGGFSMGKVHEYDFSDWKKDFDLNLHTTFLVCKYSLEKMLQYNYGRIVTIASKGAIQPTGLLASYCASKAGVVALTQAIADETKGRNITANVVLPSVIDTPTNREAMGSENAHHWVQPESLAEMICFLASESARDVRGAVIPVYGNM